MFLSADRIISISSVRLFDCVQSLARAAIAALMIDTIAIIVKYEREGCSRIIIRGAEYCFVFRVFSIFHKWNYLLVSLSLLIWCDCVT